MRPRTHPQHAAPTRPPAACTVIAANQLSFARILAESYLRHHPGAPFYLLVADPLPEGVAPPPAVTLVTPADLDLPYLEDLLATYQPAELLAALKPSLLLLLIRRFATEVVYLDPDALVMRPFAELAAAWTAGEVVLTPRLLRPSGSGDASWRERLALRDGTFNLGIVAVRRSDAAEQLLRWWEAHLRDECRADPCRGLMRDQRWLDLAPHLFPSVVAVLRDETYGVGAWSLDERALTSDDGGFRVDGRPLAFFRFEGLDPRTPDRFSIADASLAIEAGTPLADLVAHYVRLQHEHGFVRSSGWRFAYDVLVGGSFDNGIAVPAIMKELYRSLDPAERERFGDPRRTGGPASFFAWATLPRPAEGRLSPFLERVYRRRFDVAASYPDPVGADQAAFLAWARTHGAVELGYDPRLVVEPPESPASSPNVERRVGLPWGINVVGYLRNRSGVGAAARGYVRALLAVDVPVGLTDVSWMNPTPLLDRSLDGLPDDVNAYAVNLIVVNADQHPIVKERLGRAFFRDRHNVAVWAWELPSFPVAWRDRFDDYDEVWVGSSFIAEALAGVSPIPVVRIPPVLAAPAGGDRERGRRRHGVTAGQTLFAYVFDVASVVERKNPLGVIEAFRRAFHPGEPVRLVIKCANAAIDPAALHALRERARGYQIEIAVGLWSPQEMADLYAACDAYVSLHRAEGTGLTLAEAMAHGKPVIATGWSGNTDFMHAGNSFPVGYELVTLPEDVGPYEQGAVWADPSIEEAADLMRLVVADPDEADKRGVAAARDVAAFFAVGRIAGLIERRLGEIARLRGDSVTASVPPQGLEP